MDGKASRLHAPKTAAPKFQDKRLGGLGAVDRGRWLISGKAAEVRCTNLGNRGNSAYTLLAPFAAT
jgi:hypothetical protein